MFRQAGFLWLFAHELRVLWRGSILVRTHKHVLVPVLAVGLLFQAVAFILASQIVTHPLPMPEMVMVAAVRLKLVLNVAPLVRVSTGALLKLPTKLVLNGTSE